MNAVMLRLTDFYSDANHSDPFRAARAHLKRHMDQLTLEELEAAKRQRVAARNLSRASAALEAETW